MDTSERISRGFDRLGHVASPALSFVKLVLAGVVLTMILTSAAAAGPLEDGVAAYLRGDFAAALQLIRPLAEQGLADAQFYLGSMYGDGKGVPQDHAEAAKWYRLAAEQGDADAQVVLGSIYNEGEGVPQDNAQAVKW
jgi:TPR repeat protein